MSETLADMLRNLGALSEDELEQLAQEIHARLEPETPSDVAKWAEIAKTRISEIATGKVVTIPAEEVNRVMRERSSRSI